MITYHIDLNELSEGMQEKLHNFADIYQHDLLIYCGVRTVKAQNLLFRASSSLDKINKKIERFESMGRDDLAKALRDTPPVPTRNRVTNAAGGESYHNYRLAVDSVVMSQGKCAWQYRMHSDAWDDYGTCAEEVGLTWAGSWKNFRELPHIQDGTGYVLKQDSSDLVWG